MFLVWLASLVLALSAPHSVLQTATHAARRISALPVALQTAQQGELKAELKSELKAAPLGSAGCAGIPRSVPGRAVADAIASIPSLSMLSAGLGAAGLAAELNGVPQVTVFAPTNEAFASLSGRLPDGKTLRYHVVPKRLTPQRLAGTHRTLEGGQLSVVRTGSRVQVNATAGLICTRVEAANGNLYLIDSLLIPR